MTTRVDPHSLEAERSCLGALLIENHVYDQVARILAAPMFYRKAHRLMYAACVHLLEAGKRADLVTLVEELTRRGEIEDVGGPAYVASMTDGVPRSTNVRYYGEIVRDKWMLRKLAKIGGGLSERSMAGDLSPRELIASTDAALTSLASEAKLHTGAVSLADQMSAVNARFEKRAAQRGKVEGFATGYDGLDNITRGWQQSKMIVVAGDTSYGKSVFALNAALSIARQGGRVVYYSYEMPAADLTERLIATIAEVQLMRIGWWNVSEVECQRIAAAQEELAGLPIRINDGSSRSLHDARAECRQLKADEGVDAVFFDHYQLMDGVDGENRTQELAGVSRGIQELAASLGVTAFVLSQVTIPESEQHREPHLGSLRECKSLGHDADAVFFLHPYKPAEARTDVDVVPMKLLCRKNRGGRLGLVTLNLERDYVRFVEAEAPAAPVAEPKAAKPRKPVAPRW